MDGVVDEMAREFRTPAMLVWIRTPTGEYLNTHGALTDGGTESPTLDTAVRVGSNTKTWTGTIVLQMVQEGRLGIDDPVSRYRPDVPNGENITIGQLLDMRSGLASYTQTLELDRALDEEPERVWDPEDLVRLGLEQPPLFPPGTEYSYSNTNTVLLGLIAERLDGKPIADIVRDRLVTPLGLTRTVYPAATDTSMPAPFARGYTYSGNVETLGEGKEALSPERQAAIARGEVAPRDTTDDNPSWASAAGQGISSARDMATTVRAMVTGGLLDERTQELRMSSVQPSDPAFPDSGYGYGIAEMGPLYGHIGELPGYNSIMGHDPVHDVTVVAWGTLAPTADGQAPAAQVVRALMPYVYAPIDDSASTTDTGDPTGGDSAADDAADGIGGVADAVDP